MNDYCHDIGRDHDYPDAYDLARFTGTPVRRCKRCPAVTLDPLHDADTWREDDGYYGACACGAFVGPFPCELGACDALDDHALESP